MDKYTDLFSDYALKVKDISPETAHEVKRRILDSFGVMYLAFHESTPKAARNYAYMFEHKNGASLFGLNFKTTPEISAFANCVLVRYLDFNDTYLSKEPLHPSDMIPGLWSVAEWKNLSGKKLIDSIAVAYEIAVSLCDAASLRDHGWDHVNYISIGTVCGLGRLLKLKKETIENAISITIVPNSSMRQTRSGELSMWKGAAAANSVRNAIFGTLQASCGMTGPNKPFEGEMGFFRELLDGDAFDDKALISLFNADSPRRILDTYIKFYPVEYHAQSAVDISKELHRYIKSPDDIDYITIETFQAAYDIIAKDPEKWSPKTKETADHSLQYITAACILDGDISKDSFSKNKLNDPFIKNTLKKIKIKEDLELTKLYPEGIPNRITLNTRDNQTYSKEIMYPRGHSKNKMTDDEVIKKFKDNTESILSTSERDAIIDIIMNLDKCENISDITKNLRV
ncbi:MAG: MmgE/PrpD family protein [Thermodesulfobium sp.]